MISMTRIRKAITKIAYNPKREPMLKQIEELGGPDFYEKQVILCLSEAKIHRQRGEVMTYVAKMVHAIRLMILAIVEVEDGTQEGS